MDKNIIRTFAVESRRKMIESVKYQASLIGISANGISEPISEAEGMETYNYGAGTYTIYDEDIKKRESLVNEIKNKEYDNVMEEVAYTWFNRIIAIRFMEVNDFLPTRKRVLSSEEDGKTEPDMVTDALSLDLDYTDEDKQKILKYEEDNEDDKLFQFLFIKQCNKLNEILPELFEKTDDYMELLLDINYTNTEGVVRQLVDKISEEDFGNQVEIIGWIYQFYNIELKDDTFKDIKKNKVSKDRIPAATQLFTPNWIVKYMVENSLGRLWLENNSNSRINDNWRYFVENIYQNSNNENFDDIKKDSEYINPEKIKIMDPCMGSGHVLVYVFDVLMQIYTSVGYSQDDATVEILKNNIFGIDIDDRAYQLAYFAIMMKARSYNRKIFEYNINPLICSMQEPTNVNDSFLAIINDKFPEIYDDLIYLLDLFNNSKEYGSALKVKEINFKLIEDILKNLNKNNYSSFDMILYKDNVDLFLKLVKQYKFLYYEYDVVITNPPYLATRRMSNNLKNFLKKEYPNSSADFCTVFIEKCKNMLRRGGYFSMITQQSFMFLPTFENLRKELLNDTLINLIHLGPRAFEEIGGEVVQTATFTYKNELVPNFNTVFCRLVDFNYNDKEKEFFNSENYFDLDLNILNKIPGSPIAYWADNNLINSFVIGDALKPTFADARQGMATSDNKRFLRYWFEVNSNKLGFNCSDAREAIEINKKWYSYNKGGEFRKWYGNQDYVINYENDGFEVKEYATKLYKSPTRSIRSISEYFKPSLSWSMVSGDNIAFRYYPKGFIFDTAGCSIFLNDNNYRNYIFGFLNSIISKKILDLISPTLNYNVGHITSLPIIIDKIEKPVIDSLVLENISLCKNDWDENELSWNFKIHPFLIKNLNMSSLYDIFENWKLRKMNQFNTLKNNEIELNNIFSKIYQVNVDTKVEDKKISITKADYVKDIKSFISYAIGCIFGRYSLDDEGLQFAGGEFNINKYSKFVPDDDNIIPVLDTAYFDDDIVGRFEEFIKICFGDENLEENLDFIAGALKKKGNSSREIIRNYFLTDFFKDHVQTYKKCPIYWQFDSGKQNAFKCLIYMHRYEPSIVARIRTDYLHKTQRAIEQNLADCEDTIANSSNKSEIARATKDRTKCLKQIDEIRVYDEALGHIANRQIEIDLDDGVKVNYDKFQKIEISKEGEKTKKVNLLKKI